MLFKNKFLLFFVISVGSVIGIVRGEEAKQKWVFRIKSRVDNKKLIAEKKQLAKKGGVLLDDIEMASFHNNWVTLEKYSPFRLNTEGIFFVPLFKIFL